MRRGHDPPEARTAAQSNRSELERVKEMRKRTSRMGGKHEERGAGRVTVSALNWGPYTRLNTTTRAPLNWDLHPSISG